ncbi:UNVERIFIED_CONTAM: hypothetical protein Sradi_0239500 [Sesamum radiatum]|uniref:Uncharacterized protein n=1 Tax=Sesamum radiatum TaxID=300843 RepID=A0AAW2W3E7_SESRA
MADGTGLKELKEALKTNEILPMQESFRITLHNLKNSQMIMQQLIQCGVEKLQTYNRNKSLLGKGLTISAVEKGSSSRNLLEMLRGMSQWDSLRLGVTLIFQRLSSHILRVTILELGLEHAIDTFS